MGLAPGAHGANRTGRMFTGDRSGDFLYVTLHRFGFCNYPSSQFRGDGLCLYETYITAAVHCAPPQNRPLREELNQCRCYLKQELLLLKKVRVIIALGMIAWKAYLRSRQELGQATPRPLPKFIHGASYRLDDVTWAITSYHPSQQNTQTGRLTKEMFNQVFKTARKILQNNPET